ncbi:hypothetical protein [Pseudomonas syringae]|uniref:hypothetical protein n=1 Tax=Pseudomonas syringae TaxID=317 RepID=UPI001F0F46BF|nr:hypothetical protein [Pseudomonas syringae]MCH5568797.1 hypothetical protein [Pseudomonas syringae pv. syringae]
MSNEVLCNLCNKPIEPECLDHDPGLSFRTRVPDWLINKYFHALGKLMSGYSTVETDLAIQLRNVIEKIVCPDPAFYTGSAEEGKSIFNHFLDPQKDASQRINRNAAIVYLTERLSIAGYRDTLIKLMTIVNWDAKCISDLKAIFKQLEIIGQLRNRLAHNGACPDMRNKGEWFSTSNHHVKSGPMRLLYFEVNSLLRACRDLEMMPGRISDAIFPDEALEKSTDVVIRRYCESDEFKQYIADRNGPWHYKSSSLMDDPMSLK